VEKFVGDAVMAVFGVPVAHEDDALRACRAALEVLSAVGESDRGVAATHRVPLAVRVGVETGEVVVGDPARGSTFASGVAVNLAARLEQAAEPGECLLGPACHRLVRDWVDVESRPGLTLRGVPTPVDAVRLTAVRQQTDAPLFPLVGRTRELALLQQAYERAVTDGTSQLATVLGVAGMGKTRLTTEFLSSVPDAIGMHGHCVSYGEGVTFWPLVEAVRQTVGLTGSEHEQVARDRLAELLHGEPDTAQIVELVAPIAGLGGAPGTPEDTAWAVRRLLEVLALQRAVVFAVEDLHWADPGLVTLLDDVCRRLRDVPVLILVNARPEFLDDHPTWGAGQINGVTALLEPLDGDEVEALSTEVAGGPLPELAVERLRDVSGGNPLYVEHLLRMLVEDGVLRRGDHGWVLTGAAGASTVPPSVTALIAARLDRLPAEERSVIGLASVMGQVFYRAAVVELGRGDRLAAQLQTLIRKGLIRSTRTDIPGQDAFGFAHGLIRDAAYGALPKALRADLHERFARWLDKTCQGQAYDNFIGGHLEAAYRCLVELAALDERTRQLGAEAAQRLRSAALAVQFADDRKAAALLDRAQSLHDAPGPELWSLQIELARTMERALEPMGQATTRLEGVMAAAAAVGDRRWTTYARLLLAMIRQNTEPEGATEAMRDEARAAMEFFTSIADDLGLSVVHQALSMAANMTLRTSEQAREGALAAEHAEAAGRTAEGRWLRERRLLSLVMADTHAEAALEECRRAVLAADNRVSRANFAANCAFCAVLLGRSDEAEQAWTIANDLAAQLPPYAALDVEWTHAWAQICAGDWAAAARPLDLVCARLETSGAWSSLSTQSALSALVLLHTGDVVAARRRVATALRLGSSDDLMTQVWGLAARAWLAALDGGRAAATRYMDSTVEQLPDERLLERAVVHIACAEASKLIGDPVGSRGHRRAAIELYRAKGNVVGAAHQEAVLSAGGA
jgi:hypothetical protein